MGGICILFSIQGDFYMTGAHSWKHKVTALCALLLLAMPMHGAVRKDPPASIRGAIYVPYSAYNAPQMWKNFNAAETRRDLGYARKIHLNALRVWASYEYWQMEPAKFQAEFDQFLEIAHAHRIRILFSLFENDGVEPTPENMWDTNPATALDIQSPGREVAAPDHPERWEAPRTFVQWFMKRYGHDNRLLAIEVMNEPGGRKESTTVPFAKSMFITAKSMQGTVPLTVGSARLPLAEEFLPLGLDIIEFHDNFPASAVNLDQAIASALALGKQDGVPVWLTEWQRVRTGGSGFDKNPVLPDELYTDYASLAPTVYAKPVGSFFWCLMAKRAYLKGQRKFGTLNGLFWPDGAVVSIKDARAVAQDPNLKLQERPLPGELK